MQVSRAVSIVPPFDAGLPLTLMTRQKELDSALFAARTATVSMGVLGVLGAMLAVTGVFGMASIR